MKMRHMIALGMMACLTLCLTPVHAMGPVSAGMMSFKVLAIPVAPEPASLGILALGSAALLLRRHRR